MLDYLIPIAIALVGIVVMMFIFQSINKSDVSTGAVAGQPQRKSRSKKSQRPSNKYSEDVLDIATEQLIAREVARGPTGMVTDSKSVSPTTLDSIRNRRQAKEESQHTQVAGKVSDRHKQVAKDQGFTVVESQKPAPKQQQQQQQRQERNREPATSTEDLDKKLSMFFKSSGSRKLKEVKPKADENNADAAPGAGGNVTIKGDIGGAKGWPYKE